VSTWDHANLEGCSRSRLFLDYSPLHDNVIRLFCPLPLRSDLITDPVHQIDGSGSHWPIAAVVAHHDDTDKT
jgi:hypothetical protein